METGNTKLANSSVSSLSIASNTPPQASSFPAASVEKELDANFIRALHLLHSTDPDAKNELRRLVEQQIEQATANQPTNKPKNPFLFDNKKPFTPARLKEKSPQVVTTTTTLVSGGVNTMHMEELSPLLSTSKLPTVKEQFNRLSSSSSDEESPIPQPTARRIHQLKSNSPKRIKLQRALLGASDDSMDNSTDNDSFEDILTKETDKPDIQLHQAAIQKSANIEQRPTRTSSAFITKSTTAFLSQPVEKTVSTHIKPRNISTLTHKKTFGGVGHPSRMKKKIKVVKKQSFKRK